MKLAETPPTHCSVCFGQYVERRHVDFEVAWDGPVLKDEVAGGAGTTDVSIDDIIVCEECLKLAAAVIGLKDPDEMAEYAEAQEKRVDELLEKVRGLERHNGKLEEALASKKVLVGAGR